MKSSHCILRIQRSVVVEIEGQKTYTRSIAVLDANGKFLEPFHLMCAAIEGDVPNSSGAACVMNWMRKVELGELDLADVDGNAWVMNITRDKVWFEGLYSQGEGGEVSLAQFKLAVQTYLQFLEDPDHKSIEIDFPEH
ncbi:MAG: hypothetical protein O9327_10750 [Polaromonas sp.]|nr:hypothetical protein [Polaromonas sp.]